MILGDILLALILAVLAAAVFGAVARGRGGMPGIVPVFVLFFLFAWAGGLWLRPAGPPVFGLYWAPGLFLLILVFLLLAFVTGGPARTREELKEKMVIRETTVLVAGAIFWFLVAALLLAIVFGYFSQMG